LCSSTVLRKKKEKVTLVRGGVLFYPGVSIPEGKKKKIEADSHRGRDTGVGKKKEKKTGSTTRKANGAAGPSSAIDARCSKEKKKKKKKKRRCPRHNHNHWREQRFEEKIASPFCGRGEKEKIKKKKKK